MLISGAYGSHSLYLVVLHVLCGPVCLASSKHYVVYTCHHALVALAFFAAAGLATFFTALGLAAVLETLPLQGLG